MSDRVDDLAAVLAALGHPNRLRLALILTGGPCNSTELAATAGLSPALTSHHLGKLEKVGVVDRRPAGRQVQYELQRTVPETVAALVRELLVDATTPPTLRPATTVKNVGRKRRS